MWVGVVTTVLQDHARIEMRCPNCGSDYLQDAWATWDETNQRWELGGVHDHETCIECEREGDDHFERIDLPLDGGMPEHCVSGLGRDLQPHPATGVEHCTHCCPIANGERQNEMPSTDD